MDALIRFYLHYDCKTEDDFADMWSKILYLEKLGLLAVPQIPLKLHRK